MQHSSLPAATKEEMKIAERMDKMDKSKAKSWATFWRNINFLERTKNTLQMNEDSEVDDAVWEALDSAQIAIMHCKAIIMRGNLQ